MDRVWAMVETVVLLLWSQLLHVNDPGWLPVAVCAVQLVVVQLVVEPVPLVV